jgi:ppGpp synthetase/RelA/SpoT-type nucleotidyltranferase
MSHIDVTQIAKRYAKQRPAYEALAKTFEALLKISLQKAGIRATVTSRAKEIPSLVKKCLVYNGPLGRVRDRAGVKITVRYQTEVQAVCGIIEQEFDCSEPDAKAKRYKPNELGYLGTHYHAKLKPGQGSSRLRRLECEIIVHTGAEGLWDGVSHQLIYKPYTKLHDAEQRSIMSLLVLVELFDKEVSAVRAKAMASPDYSENAMLDVLEKYFYQLDPRDFRRDLSIKTLHVLAPLVAKGTLEHLDAKLADFVSNKQASLQNAYSKHTSPDDSRGLFLHQPESLLIFFLFGEGVKRQLVTAWESEFPRYYLDELSDLWGTALPK